MYYRRKVQVESPKVDSPESARASTPPLPPRNSSLAKQRAKQESQAGRRPGSTGDEENPETVMQLEGLYIISVAARILDMHPQTLRKYERLGLINPGRTIGMLRLYSAEDIRKVRLIRHLVDRMGFNLAGVEHTLRMVDALLNMKERLMAQSDSKAMAARVEQEIARLFRDLGLPVEE